MANKEIIKAKPSLVPPAAFNNNNCDVVNEHFVGGDLNLYENNYQTNIKRVTLPLGFEKSNEYYGLLSCDYDDDNVFILHMHDNAYCQNTSKEICNYLGILNEEAIRKIASIPVLVFRKYKEPSDSDVAVYGFITSFERKGNQINFSFFAITTMKLKDIHNNLKALNIEKSNLNHPFENDSFIFRNGDIVEILKTKGINLPKF